MKRIVTVAGFALLMLALPVVVQASIFERDGSWNCSNALAGKSLPWVCMSEDGNMGGDLLLSDSGTDHAELTLLPHTLPGNCGVIGESWNNCISDAWVRLPGHTCFRAYHDINYSGIRIFAASNLTNVTAEYSFPTGGAGNDQVGSFRVYAC